MMVSLTCLVVFLFFFVSGFDAYRLHKTKPPRHYPSTSTHSPSALHLVSIPELFNVATFLPQPFWLLMIGLPNWKGTKAVMGPFLPIAAFSAVHLLIVSLSISQPDGTAPMAEFAGVFDPAGDPLGAMSGMMRYPNFVSEEWSHVLTWDLFVGRWIWLDGIKRGVFTPHSVLLTNLIGPPGLLLHFATCYVTGKGLPPSELLSAPPLPPPLTDAVFAQFESKPRADELLASSYATLYETTTSSDGSTVTYTGVERLMAVLAENIEWEDTGEKESTSGPAAVRAKLLKRVKSATQTQAKTNTITITLAVEKIAQGATSTGCTYQLIELDSTTSSRRKGLRGTTFLSLDGGGKITYVREVVEPLFKPGSRTASLLKAVAEAGLKKLAKQQAEAEASGLPFSSRFLSVPNSYTPRNPKTASDAVNYLWNEVQGSDKAEALRLFSEDIFYQDLNFESPFQGKVAVSAFLDEFDIPGIRFIPERVSQYTPPTSTSTSTTAKAATTAKQGCCFTWRVEIAGTEGSTRGISFYEFTPDREGGGGVISYIRDIPEPAIKPPPLQYLASLLEPGLRVFRPEIEER